MQSFKGKLVRDKIPALIQARGGSAVSHVLDDVGFSHALREKLIEEANEAAEADDGELLEELADVYEVLSALAAKLGLEMTNVQEAAAAKAQERGTFRNRTWLESYSG